MNIKKAIQTLADQPSLPTAGPWRLATDETGLPLDDPPPGGWSAFCALVAGTEMMEASRTEFKFIGDPETLQPEIGIKIGLLRVFTERLVPPTTAAGLFILAGVHPAYGLHVARARNQWLDGERPEDHAMVPLEAVKIVDGYLASIISEIIDCLVATGGEPFDSKELASDLRSIFDQDRPKADLPSGILAPFIDSDLESRKWRVLDFVVEDLLKSWLVPAQAATLHHNETATVDVETLRLANARA